MRGEHARVEHKQWVVRPRRLLRKYVEYGAGNLTATKRRLERDLVDDATARSVDDVGPAGKKREFIATDEPTC